MGEIEGLGFRVLRACSKLGGGLGTPRDLCKDYEKILGVLLAKF